jgi:predicted transcriptional regulator
MIREVSMSEGNNIERKDVLFSIRPNFAEKIINGSKTVELRRRFTHKVKAGAIALIYCTSPTKAIVGAAVIVGIECLPIKTIWDRHGAAAEIRRTDFNDYFFGCKEGFAILLRKPVRFEKQVKASNLKKRFGFVAPQSFIYLPKKYYALLEHGQLQTSH